MTNFHDIKPVPVKPPHEHQKPVFGCLGCINGDRDAFASKAYKEWKATFKLPSCKECGKPMLHYGYSYTPTAVKAEICCSAHDGDGVPTCEDTVEFVIA